MVVASAVALAEAVPDASLRPAGFALHTRARGRPRRGRGLLLVDAGYERVEQVEERGQFAVRGGILDVFPATEERAVRIELFGDEVESMRWFSTFTQRSLGEAERVELAPAAELDAEHRELAELAAMEAEEEGARPRRGPAAGPLRRPARPGPRDGGGRSPPPRRSSRRCATTGRTRRRRCTPTTPATSTSTSPSRSPARAALSLGAAAGRRGLLPRSRAESPPRSIKEAEGELEKLVRSGYRTVVAFDSRGEAERARYGLTASTPPFLGRRAPRREPGRRLRRGAPARGLRQPRAASSPSSPSAASSTAAAAAEPAPGARPRPPAFSDLRVGDYVVHEDHGVARFAGFETHEVGGVTRDYLYLEYKGEDRVFAPTDQLAKLSRYVGAGGEPALSALGGKRWQNMKARARRAAGALAGELLNLYAERRTRRGHAFPPDGEMADRRWRPPSPTARPPTRWKRSRRSRRDMESEQPMDRLICGDVGFGKTEVALRAAHKAAADGKQVMMLVPTTILAQQHFGTFRERLADLPFDVERVSRLRKPAEVKAGAGSASATGKVDILIGTHRLLSRDVRAKDLGLVIVDEEQRFGVKQKELLRQLKLKVDVLSLSATPIPRTLQMSLAGLRDISVIETPPEGRRPVRTYVGPYDEDLVQRAIERELERGGQAFFLHNRIDSLHETAERLRALCPGRPLRRGARADGRARAGGDDARLPPRRARLPGGDDDHRVGPRHPHRQHADRRARRPARPRAGVPDPRPGGPEPRARLRLPALSLGRVADPGGGGPALDPLRPHRARLRLPRSRCATSRSAAPATCSATSSRATSPRSASSSTARCSTTRRRSCAPGPTELPEEPREPVRIDVDVDAYVPADYIPFEAAKIDVHRRVAAAREPGELRAIRDELEDRFGPLPESVANLLDLQRVRIELGDAGVRNVEFRGGRLRVSADRARLRAGRRAQRARPRGDLSVAGAHDRRPGPRGGRRAPRRPARARRRAWRGSDLARP